MATDLHAAIRERLEEVQGPFPDVFSAITALLDWHALGWQYYEEPGKLPNWCHACNDIGPCETVQIIARELGIET